MDNTHKITSGQLGNIRDRCYKIDALALVLRVDRRGKLSEAEVLSEWEHESQGLPFSNIAEIIQELNKGILDTVEDIEYPKE